MLKLYSSPGACSMACHIALEEAGADFTPVVVSIPKGEHRDAAYRRINPRGLVPVLEMEDETRLNEAVAILLHTARRFPEAGLLPEAASLAEARAFEWLAWLTNTMHIAYGGLWRPERFTDDPSAGEALKAFARSRIEALNDEVETRLGQNAYTAGEAYSVADPFLLVFFYWANRIGLDATGRQPRWAAHAARLAQRPAVARVLEREGVDLWK